MVHFARTSGYPAFDAKILQISVPRTHLSAQSCYVFAQSDLSEWATRLTARELQISGEGLTNTEIGIELWITQNSVKQALKRMFRKLNVSARADGRPTSTDGTCNNHETTSHRGGEARSPPSSHLHL